MKNLVPTFEEHHKFLNEAKTLFPNDCKVGVTYEIGYSSIKVTSKFLGWFLPENESPRMRWIDEGGIFDWEAYMYKGFMAVSSSADKLIVYKEV